MLIATRTGRRATTHKFFTGSGKVMGRTVNRRAVEKRIRQITLITKNSADNRGEKRESTHTSNRERPVRNPPTIRGTNTINRKVRLFLFTKSGLRTSI
jgi:hypothetical protein